MAQPSKSLPAGRSPTLSEVRAERARRSFAYFVEATTNFQLDPWQRVLCGVLERLRHERGRRILIHGPPQWGKSVLISQRFPAWLIGHRPENRVKLACYNISHATRFGKVLLELMQSRDYADVFPSSDVRVPKLASAAEWTTQARGAVRDAQPSFAALGLVSGFVGQGADLLIIDDPYASPQDAASPITRESVFSFWNEGARVRLNDDTNVVVMFHRYHADDLAGRLWASGGWEMLRFAAECDDDPGFPPDPMERPAGERLSPRMSDEYLAEQKKDDRIWLTQFQGRPAPREGAMFKVGKFQFIDAHNLPPMAQVVRAWDLAATAGGGKRTAGVKMGRDYHGRIYVLDVNKGQWSTDERDREIRDTARADGAAVPIRGPQDPAAAGKQAAEAFVRNLHGFTAKTELVSGDKVTRADPFSSQVNAGNVYLIAGAHWVPDYTEELKLFPYGTFSDQVDASSDGYAELSKGVEYGETRIGGEAPVYQSYQPPGMR